MTAAEKGYLEGVAYHEAAHTVLAALLRFPLSESGLCLYDNGGGEAHYRRRKPDGSRNVGPDRDRENTIIVALAGQIAHSKVHSFAATDANAREDIELTISLLNEMYADRAAQHNAWEVLRTRSEELVTQHWGAIETLAELLWARPWEPADESPLGKMSEKKKNVRRSEVVRLLDEFKIQAILA
jgi:hypothetical protein